MASKKKNQANHAKTITKKKSATKPYKFILLVLAATIAGTVFYDINQHGNWDNSVTKKTLKDLKVCEGFHFAVDRVKEGFHWSSGKIEEQFPGFQQTVITLYEPYAELTRNLMKISRNALYNLKDCIVEKYPVAVVSVQESIPVLVEGSQKIIVDVYSTSVFYLNRGIDYLKNEVFVGQLSPENMQKVMYQALNTTQHKATEYYHWIYKKVQTSIK